MSTVGFCLEPLDVLFFRDGKPFGAATRASSSMPMPQTLTGALRTALLERRGFDFERLAARLRENRKNGSEESIMDALRGCGAAEEIIRAQVRGPFLAHLDKEGKIGDVLVPMPAILHQTKDKEKSLHRLEPLKRSLPGWRERLRPLWLRYPEPTEAAKGYLTRNGQQALLRGEVPAKKDVIQDEALFGFDHRTGIEIAPDPLSAKEGGIYGATFLALRPGYTAPKERVRNENESPPAVVLYAEMVFPNEMPPECKAMDNSTLPLGGEGRRVAVRTMDTWNWPHCQPNDAKQKPLLVLTTPGFFKERWLPEILQDKLIAAAVPGAVAVSGWDLARNGPKPNRFAAAAGSVYFLDSLPDNLPDALSDLPEDRAQGWGCYLKGVWTDG